MVGAHIVTKDEWNVFMEVFIKIDICKAIQLLKLTIEDIPIVCTRVGHYSVLTG